MTGVFRQAHLSLIDLCSSCEVSCPFIFVVCFPFDSRVGILRHVSAFGPVLVRPDSASECSGPAEMWPRDNTLADDTACAKPLAVRVSRQRHLHSHPPSAIQAQLSRRHAGCLDGHAHSRSSWSLLVQLPSRTPPPPPCVLLAPPSPLQ